MSCCTRHTRRLFEGGHHLLGVGSPRIQGAMSYLPPYPPAYVQFLTFDVSCKKDSWCELSYQLTSARLRDTDVAYGQLTPATCQEEVEAGRKKLCVSLTDGSTIMCDVLVAAGMHPFTLAVLPFTAASLALCGARAHICGACCRWRALKDPSVHSARPTQVHGRDFHLRNQSERPSAVPGRERASA